MADTAGAGSAWYAQLHQRLKELHYAEALDPTSAELVDHLLQDLLKSVESFHLLKQRYEDVCTDQEKMKKEGYSSSKGKPSKEQEAEV